MVLRDLEYVMGLDYVEIKDFHGEAIFVTDVDKGSTTLETLVDAASHFERSIEVASRNMECAITNSEKELAITDLKRGKANLQAMQVAIAILSIFQDKEITLSISHRSGFMEGYVTIYGNYEDIATTIQKELSIDSQEYEKALDALTYI